ncbi:uncharacterized protein LOC135383098 [Ornithodoros turicata]|uniref:uncharacterized protein LOC135383098 n=1 Tax=Ornithodoros turicata TaxID=34597 RepID=UPI0031387DD1
MDRAAMDGRFDTVSRDERIDRVISNITKALHIQKEEVQCDIEKTVAEICNRLLSHVDDVFRVKLQQLKRIGEEAITGAEDTMRPDVFYTSTPLRSLLSSEWLSNPLLVPTTLGYFKACQARPENITFAQNYSSRSRSVGDTVKLYYVCTTGYEPFLFDFISCMVRDPSGADVEHWSGDSKDGRYSLKFIVRQEGRYTVYVRLYRVPIRGIPFLVDVSRNQPSEQTPSVFMSVSGKVHQEPCSAQFCIPNGMAHYKL